MNSTERTLERRSYLRVQPGCMFVDADKFRDLATSTRRFLRSDDPVAEVRGLFDPETHERFITEEENLFGLGKAADSC